MFDEKKQDEALPSERQTSNEPVDMFSEAGATASASEMTEGQLTENATEETRQDAAMEEEYEDSAPNSGKRHMILALIAIVALILIIGGGVSLVFLLKPKQAAPQTSNGQELTGLVGDITGVSAARERARDSKRISDIKQLQAALEIYASDKSSYPATDNFSTALLDYLSPLPEDPTNNVPFVYIYNAKPDGCTAQCVSYELTYQLETEVGTLAPGVTQIVRPSEDISGEAPTTPSELSETPEVPVSIPDAADSDGDGLSDVQEAQYGTNSNLFDSDGDSLSDREELEVYGTDPLNADSDKDGFLDGEEIQNGYDPNGSGKLPNTSPQ